MRGLPSSLLLLISDRAQRVRKVLLGRSVFFFRGRAAFGDFIIREWDEVFLFLFHS